MVSRAWREKWKRFEIIILLSRYFALNKFIGEQTAARCAYQTDAAENYSGSRTMSATEKFYHKEHKEHKESIEGRFAAESSKSFENVESRFVPLVRGRAVRLVILAAKNAEDAKK